MTEVLSTTLRASPPLASSVEDADVHASSDEYAARFGHATGQWMLAVQERKLLRLLDEDITSVLDVGGGHGQIALPLSRAQRAVTVLGSSPVCATQLTQDIERGIISFKCGNLIDLPFDAGSFNLVTSFRLMSHCAAWKTLISEMCRVSNHAVIVDYPVWLSVNVLSPLLFSLKRRIEGNTRTFKLFSNREIVREFKSHGFRLVRIERQFVWPMALHRALASPELSRTFESIARALLLRRLFGSPVIAKFVRE
jgi:2-polyprenyl-3-methyl-5-hydroxy-6-metoxy-1,4-benzoquinol methylase